MGQATNDHLFPASPAIQVQPARRGKAQGEGTAESKGACSREGPHAAASADGGRRVGRQTRKTLKERETPAARWPCSCHGLLALSEKSDPSSRGVPGRSFRRGSGGVTVVTEMTAPPLTAPEDLLGARGEGWEAARLVLTLCRLGSLVCSCLSL